MLTYLCFEITGIFQKFQSPGLISEQLNLSPREWGTVYIEAPRDASVLGTRQAHLGTLNYVEIQYTNTTNL